MKIAKIYEAYRDVDHEKNIVTGDGVSHAVVDKPAIRKYTMDSYEYNDILHRHKSQIKGPKPTFSKYHIINGLQEEIHAQPKHETELHVFSGTSFDVFRMYAGKIHLGNPIEIVVHAFTSTSSDYKIAASYAKRFSNIDDVGHDAQEIVDFFQHSTSGTSYRHVLCFELYGKKALKIDADTGGYFGDEEKEFILPHSITVQIHGLPTFDKEFGVFVWDAKILTDFDKATVEMIEYNPQDHEFDAHKILKIISNIDKDHSIDDSILLGYLKNLKDAVKQLSNDFMKHGHEGKLVAKYINLILGYVSNKNDLMQVVKEPMAEIVAELNFTEDYLTHALEPGQKYKQVIGTFKKIMGHK